MPDNERPCGGNKERAGCVETLLVDIRGLMKARDRELEAEVSGGQWRACPLMPCPCKHYPSSFMSQDIQAAVTNHHKLAEEKYFLQYWRLQQQ